jgi:hypothetical protein
LGHSEQVAPAFIHAKADAIRSLEPAPGVVVRALLGPGAAIEAPAERDTRWTCPPTGDR